MQIAVANQLPDVGRAAGVYDGRAANQQRFSSALARAEYFHGDLPDGDALGLFGGDGAVHEFKRLPYAFALLGEYTHAGVTNHDGLATLDIGHRHAAGDLGVAIDQDAAIHFLVGNLNPVTVEPNFGALVGGAVKAFGERPGNIGVFQPGVVERSRHGPMIGNLAENFRQRLGRFGTHFQQRVAGIGPALTDRDSLNLKGPATGHDHVENLRQNQAVDDVPANFDFFDKRHRRRWVWLSHGIFD